jgi:ABC-type nitrate/sulfonate/bicarbonate transport system permease component
VIARSTGPLGGRMSVSALPPFRLLGRIAKVNERLFYGVLGFVGLALVWETTANLGLYRKSLLSTPSAIWKAAMTDFGSGTILPHILISLEEFAFGFLVSMVIAVPLGLAIGWFRRVDYALSALLAALNATPNVALIPLIVLLAGIGLESKVIVVFLSAFFAIMVTTFAGVQSIARRHLEITRSFGGSRWLAFRTVALPSTFPFILSGIRIGVGRALVGVVSAEFIAANQGLGFYIGLTGSFLDTSRVMLGIVLFGIFGVMLGELLRLVEKRFEVWRPEIHR